MNRWRNSSSEKSAAFSDQLVREKYADFGKNLSTLSTVKLLPPEETPFTATDTGRSKRRDIKARNRILALRVSPVSPAPSIASPKRVRMLAAERSSPAFRAASVASIDGTLVVF